MTTVKNGIFTERVLGKSAALVLILSREVSKQFASSVGTGDDPTKGRTRATLTVSVQTTVLTKTLAVPSMPKNTLSKKLGVKKDRAFGSKEVYFRELMVKLPRLLLKVVITK